MKVKIRLVIILVVVSILVVSLVSITQKVLAATGGGTATIGVDGGSQSAGVTVVQSTSHTFATVLTINTSGMTLGAASPTFTIPTGFTAPNTNAVATAGAVDVDGEWSVVASGGGCTVDSSPVSSTTVASGQVITVDITADCANGHTITLTYKGASSIVMSATALTVKTADAGDPGPVTALIAGSPTITVTAAATPTPSPSPTPTTAPTSSDSGSSGSSSSSDGTVCSSITTIPIIMEARRVSSTSIYISWGPYAGISNFNIQYGFSKNNLQFSTAVTGFSTTINYLPTNQPIWIRIAATNNCYLGTYSVTKFVGVPGLPDAGFAPLK